MEKNQEHSFEDALRELEQVVATLENGGVGLEKSLALLQRGLELSALCEKVLDEAELTLEQLVVDDEGELLSKEIEGEK